MLPEYACPFTVAEAETVFDPVSRLADQSTEVTPLVSEPLVEPEETPLPETVPLLHGVLQENDAACAESGPAQSAARTNNRASRFISASLRSRPRVEPSPQPPPGAWAKQVLFWL